MSQISASGSPQKLGVLLLEDSLADARLFLETLKEDAGADDLVIRQVRTLADAKAEMRRFSFTVVLVDLGLPDGQGVGNVEALRAIDPSVAIVVLTGTDDELLAAQAIRMGAQEYIIKGQFDGTKMLRVLRHAVERNNRVFELEDQRYREFYRASHDSLTGLANRELIHDRMAQLLAQAKRSGENFALCYLDLNGFKAVNDQHGHPVGDALLMRVSEILNESVRLSDTVARVGGDEFLVLLWPIDEKTTDVAVIPRRLGERVKGIRQIGRHPVTIDVSVGVVIYPQHGDTLATLVERGDRAMYEAKRSGGGVKFYDPKSLQVPEDVNELRVELKDAIANDEFSLLYHPWVDTHTRSFVGLEVLLRWDRDGVEQRPGEFLRGAAEAGSSSEIGIHVATKAFAQYKEWRDQGLVPGSLALNLSEAELSDEHFLPALAQLAMAAGVSPDEIRLEVPVSALSSSLGANAAAQLRRGRDQGFRIVLDQLGPEGEALKWLTAVPLDGIKLDRHMLRSLNEEGMQGPVRRFFSAVLGAATAMGLPVIGTGAETSDDRIALQMMGCSLMQGQLFCDSETAGSLPARLRLGPAGLESLQAGSRGA